MSVTFTEDWFCIASQTLLAELVAEVADVPGMLLEIGAWEGRSTIAMANAAHPRIVDTVDTWEGSHGEISRKLAGERDVFARFTQNIADGTQGNVRPHRMGWREFVPTISGPVALAFIDAEHTYVEVRDQIRNLMPLMASGGVICGDDITHPPVREAVVEMLGLEDLWVGASMWFRRIP